MKRDIHPEYRQVVFLDTQNGTSFITRSTIKTTETTTVEGVEYPLAKVEISSASHPFFTGTMTIVDTAGRVERFEKRYGRRKKKAARGGDSSTPKGSAGSDSESAEAKEVDESADVDPTAPEH